MDFKKSRISADRSFWSYSKVQGVMSRLMRNRRFQVTEKARSFDYLNVGCGPFPTEGFCNIDYGWRPGVMAFDITRGIPLPDSSLRGIYTEHCLEHISHEECVGVLREFRRLLKPGGVARVVVPDAEIYCRLYVGALDGSSVTWPYAEPDKLPIHYVNRIMRVHGHRFIL